MHQTLTSEPVPAFPFISHVLRGYRRWEEEQFPKAEHRLGLPATIMQQVWFDGMAENADARAVRDASMLVLSYCLNGLRESSVLSLQTANVALSTESISARISIVKGKMASEVAPVSYARLSSFALTIDLWPRWSSIRGQHERWFGLPGESREWSSGVLTQAMARCLSRLGVVAPSGGKHTSHSCRIWSHTEQVLLGIPLEVRLSRYGWGAGSHEMATLCFDRTITTSPA